MKKIILVALLSIGILFPSRAVRADVSPPPAPQLGGLEPFEYQETNVQMLYERVEMELESFNGPEESSRPQSRVDVTAYFTMRNQGDLAESMQVIFPLESFPIVEWVLAAGIVIPNISSMKIPSGFP